ncbi:hypothetical protein N2152v2_004672 [Parachlorella kessleri]
MAAPPSPSKLTDELTRRLRVLDQAEPSQLPQQQQQQRRQQNQHERREFGDGEGGEGQLPADHVYFCEPRHDEASAPMPGSYLPHEQAGSQALQHQGGGGGAGEAAPREGLVSKWRQKERLKTTAVALVVCLNIGVDPPDVVKISPCARLECWVDPLSMQAPKALDTIGKNLQAQYERWQPRAKYKMHLDPTTEDVKKLAISCRRTAKNERVLFHYNGHGVPRPTANGEVWVFNKTYTQYIPLSIYDLQTWVGTPAIYVFDCSAAGQILNSFKQFMFQRQQEAEGYLTGAAGRQAGYPHTLAAAAAAAAAVGSLPSSASSQMLGERPDPMRECILLCACAENEVLPQNPDLPADIFTSCLTTPIKVALRWFCSRSLLRHEGVTKELIDRIPGKQTDRKTPLGELNWIFTAITDTIAWNVLPRALFQKLFRQDLLVASLFRNLLLAERIMRGANCSPCTYPRLPPTHQHPMWQAWDMAAEMCLLQLPELLSGEGSQDYQPSPFFSEQLTAFELWLEHGSPDKRPPEQLPIVLQVLLSQVHRLRALVLLGRFLDMGAWAVDLALSVGIFPYVLKLLQTTASDLRQTLVFIWAKIMAWDANTQVQGDLVKDGGHAYFVRHLESRDPGVPPESRARAAFVLAAICSGHPKGQLLCAQAGLMQVCLSQLPATLVALRTAQQEGFAAGARSMGQLVKWLLLCLGKLWEDVPPVTAMGIREQAQEKLAKLVGEDNADIRAAAVFALGALIQAHEGGAPAGSSGSPPSPSPASPGGSPSSPSPAALDAALAAPLGEQERLAVERAVACALLELVYDASPLVRAEVATSLARLAVGHSLLFADAVHAHQRTSARIMHRMRSSQNLVSSAPAETTSRSAAASAGSSAALPVGASAPQQAATIPPPIGNGQTSPVGSGDKNGAGGGSSSGEARGGGGIPTGPSSFSPGGSSPGVRLRDDQAYEPMLTVGLEQAHLGGVYASADAARVGGGLYLAVVEALCTLATDPSPRVAAAGQAALRSANVELVEVSPAGSAKQGAGGKAAAGQGPSSPRRAMSMSTAGSLGGGSSSSVSSLLPRGWQSKTWRSQSGALPPRSQTPPPPAGAGATGASAAAGAAGAGGSQNSSPRSSPTGSLGLPATYTRASFVLRRAPDAGDALQQQQQQQPSQPLPAVSVASMSRQASAQSVASSSYGVMGTLDSRSMSAQPSNASLLLGGTGNGPAGGEGSGRRGGLGGGVAALPPGLLPPSGTYRSSCQRFTWPLLSQQGGLGVEEGGEGEGEGFLAHVPWAGPPDQAKARQRLLKREEDLVRCRTVGANTRRARLRETVLTVDTEAERNTALLLDPFKSLVTSVDGEGVVRVSNYLQQGTLNRFHVATGDVVYDVGTGQRTPPQPPVTVTALYQLNELTGGLLLACAADGAVRVWRNYAVRGSQRLATSWQSVLVASQGTPSKPAVFEWAPRYGMLFAAGGRLADRVYMWDLQRETCVSQLYAGGPPSSSNSSSSGASTPLDASAAAAPGGAACSAAAGGVALEHLACYRSQGNPVVLAGDACGVVRIFDLRTGALAGSTQHLRSRLAGLVVEPGGREHQVVLGYPNGQLAFMDCRVLGAGAGSAEGGSPASPGRVECGVWKTLEAHSKGPMTALVAHTQAPLLATATAQQVVKVWSAGGEQVGVVRAHTSFLSQRIGPVTCMAWAPYDLCLASAGVDPIVACLRVDLAQPAPAGGQPSVPSSPLRQASGQLPPPLRTTI